MLVHVYKVKHGLSPSYLFDEFTRVSDVHSYNLRPSRSNYSLAYCSSPVGTFNQNAILDWNMLPSQVKDCTSVTTFKAALKQYLQGA